MNRFTLFRTSVMGLLQPMGHGVGMAAALTFRSGGWLHAEQYQQGGWPGVVSHHMGLWQRLQRTRGADWPPC